MTKEKNIDTSKQENQSQDQFAAERLTDEELENVAGGTGEETPQRDQYHCHMFEPMNF